MSLTRLVSKLDSLEHGGISELPRRSCPEERRQRPAPGRGSAITTPLPLTLRPRSRDNGFNRPKWSHHAKCVARVYVGTYAIKVLTDQEEEKDEIDKDVKNKVIGAIMLRIKN